MSDSKSQNDSSPFISVVTACYNSSDTIRDTVDSVRSQDFGAYEHIIIDGCSTDETCAIVESYCDSRIKVISERDDGIYDAMNKGIRMAKGEYIATLNSDDYYVDGNVFSRVHDAVISNDFPDIVYGNKYNLKNGILELKIPEMTKKKPRRLHMPVFHPATFIKSSVYREVGLYDLSYRLCADYLYLWRCHAQGLNFCYVNNVFTVMRCGGASDQNWKRQHEEVDRVLSEIDAPIFDRLQFKCSHYTAIVKSTIKELFLNK